MQWSNTNAKFFSDADALYSAIDDGKFFHADVETKPEEVFHAMARALLAATMSTVWSSGERSK